jgi:hypothetical protein
VDLSEDAGRSGSGFRYPGASEAMARSGASHVTSPKVSEAEADSRLCGADTGA